MEHAVTFVTVRCDARFITETIREITESMFDTCKKKGKNVSKNTFRVNYLHFATINDRSTRLRYFSFHLSVAILFYYLYVQQL